jgi:predicted nucleic acid-binding protein
VKRKKVLDSYAMLAYLNREPGFDKVLDSISDAERSGGAVLMNEINLGEVYYILMRKRGAEAADYFMETILPSLPVARVAADMPGVLDAARLKAAYPLAFADCFAASTAIGNDADLLTGDPEFERIAHLVTIEWISKS